MSIARALQSYAFYLLSCSPCNTEIQRRQIKRDAKKQRRDKEREQHEHGAGIIYQQPSAGTTNPYWLEEFHMGPHTNRRKNGTVTSKSGSQRQLTSAGGDSVSVGDRSNAGTTIANPTRNTNSTFNASNSDNTNNSITSRYKVGDKLNEASIGRSNSSGNVPGIADAITGLDLSQSLSSSIPSGSSGSRTTTMGANDSTTSRTTKQSFYELQHREEIQECNDSDEQQPKRAHIRGRLMVSSGHSGTKDYFDRRNPPVNDLHPPIVRQPSDKSASQWMVAPPPPAKFMHSRSQESGSWSSRHFSQRPRAKRANSQSSDVDLLRSG
ncbi:hypothetical protein GGR50DRAFT_386859 [Xylaria sp. CBS 124048]|nr:hypothetical protein GGR50DRAFT_386859 [Xylaria sp. CBS 124048]